MIAATLRRTAALVAAGGLTLTASGCIGPSFDDFPLPGTKVDGDAIELSARFDQALNLAGGATVKVNGISVGKVQEVRAENFQAVVVFEVEEGAQIRETASARLRYNTPLGELFVDVSNPTEGPVLADGGEIKATATAPTVEDALASASLLINGGGLSQLEQVTNELNNVLGGREAKIGDTLRQINTFLSSANRSTADIDRALKALNQVSAVLNQREETINKAVTDFVPAAKVLRENTDEFVAMLKALQKFTTSANGLASQTKDDLIRVLQQLSPILAELQSLGGDFGGGLNRMTTIAKELNQVVAGDYLNLNLIIVMQSIGPVPIPGGSTGAPAPAPGAGGGGLSLPDPGDILGGGLNLGGAPRLNTPGGN